MLLFGLLFFSGFVYNAESSDTGNKTKPDLSYDKGLLNSYKQPYNIEAYFMFLPQAVLYLDYDNRKSILKDAGTSKKTPFQNKSIIVDNKNGFLSVQNEGEGGGDSLEITYWVLKDKTRLIAVNRSSWGMCCPESKLQFFTFNNYAWKDVTDEFFPALKLSDFIIEKYLKDEDRNKKAPIYISLPRKGKNIEVQLGADIGEKKVTVENRIQLSSKR